MFSLETTALFYILIGIAIGMFIHAKIFPWLDQVIDDHKKKENNKATGQMLLNKIEGYLFGLYEYQGWVDKNDLEGMGEKAELWKIADEAKAHFTWIANREGYTITVTTNIPGEMYELKGTWEPPKERIVNNQYYSPRFQLAE